MQRTNLKASRALVLVGLLGWATGLGAASEPAKRLHANIQGNQTYVLKGHIHPLVAQGLAHDQGEVSGSRAMPRMALYFSMTAAQEADLAQLLKAQQDRRSPQFHQFLTPEQYAARFGMNSQDLAKVKTWLESSGFTNVQASRSRRWVDFEGTASIVQYAFHTSIHSYTINGETHIANAGEPSLPKELSGVAGGIHGLHNFIPKAHFRKMAPRFTSSISGSTYIAPSDWATIYDVKKLYTAGLDGSPIANASGNYCGGSPCSIVVVGQSDVNAADLANFRSAAGLAAKTITTIVPPGDNDPGYVVSPDDDEGESDLDLEWANGIAKNANVLFVTADSNPHNGVEDSIEYAIDNNVAPILSTSYGLCEVKDGLSDITFQEGLYQQANAQGMTVVAAAGDAGAADCDTSYPASNGLAVDYPASSNYVTGVGGTQVTVYNVTGTYWGSSNDSGGGSALQYIPEVVWNDTSSTVGLAAGGGGVSVYQTKPSWQTGTGVPSDGHRDVPDIALIASPDEAGLLYCTPASTTSYTSCSNGFRNSDTTLNVTGGTSAGAPTFAGVLALLVQQQGARLGNVNPNLYTLAGISQTAFHDITSGSNIVPCTVPTTLYPDTGCTNGKMGYSAGTGYDQASGLGSIDAYNLAEQWTSDIKISASPATLSIQPGSSGTSTITVAPYGGFTGTVSFSCTVASALANVTCSLPSTTVSTSGSTTLTVTAASNAGAPWWRRLKNLPPAGVGLLFVGLAMAASLLRMRKQRFAHVWGAAAMLALLLGAVSCGGGSSSGSSSGSGGTTSESGTVVVTATSGQIVNSVSIAVTIP